MTLEIWLPPLNLSDSMARFYGENIKISLHLKVLAKISVFIRKGGGGGGMIGILQIGRCIYRKLNCY